VHRSLVLRATPFFIASALTLAAASAGATREAVPVLRIDTGTVTAHVSPIHAGLMTEEINHSYDGGLYAELLRDRAVGGEVLARADALGAWELIGKLPGRDNLALDVSKSLSNAIPASLRIDAVSASPNNRVGVANEGFWGIPVRPNTQYHLSFYGNAAAGFSGPLRVSLESKDGSRVFARAEFSLAPGGEWKKYEAVLMTDSAASVSADTRLTIATEHPGTFWLTLVSLFPPTWKDRPNGNRIDLMEKLSALHPKFLRFPGGAYLNGETVDTRYDWKKTLGPLTDRGGHPSPWRYWSSDGMGLLEFLEWCEDLRMEPVLGVHAGSDEIPVGPQLQPFVQDTLDEIEYVSGDANTKWGAKRAQDGHPAPFKLTYVEIGNEESGPTYDARFAQFHDAIKARHPKLQLIATSVIAGSIDSMKPIPIKSRMPDVLDDHFYLKATEMFKVVGHYDHYDRKGPKIFVGEWATIEGSPTPTFQSALGDAAWMIGMERNADIVIMQAYAPLFVNVNKGARQWPTNLIGYDALGSFGSPSYYAQVIFNSHRGDEVLACPPSVAANFFTSATRDSKTGTIYIKAVNAAAMSRTAEIEIAGPEKISQEGKVISLAGHPGDINSIQEPTKIAPVEQPLAVSGNIFEQTFPQSSITVLELHAK